MATRACSSIGAPVRTTSATSTSTSLAWKTRSNWIPANFTCPVNVAAYPLVPCTTAVYGSAWLGPGTCLAGITVIVTVTSTGADSTVKPASRSNAKLPVPL